MITEIANWVIAIFVINVVCTVRLCIVESGQFN